MENWDDLRFFLAVAETGAVTAAATELGVNHSTVSRRIGALEAAADVRLFDRAPEGYVLTQAGLALLERAKPLSGAFHEVSRTLAAHSPTIAGELSVTAPQAAMVHVVMPMLRGFRRQYPEIRLKLVASDDVSNLRRRETDVAIRACNGPDESLVGRKLCAQKTAVYADRDYWARLDGEDPAWISPSLRPQIPEWAKRTYPNMRAGVCVNGKLETFEAVRAGLGVARLPCRLGGSADNLVRVPPDEPGADLDIWLLMHASLQSAPRVRAFADFIYEAFKTEAPLFEGR